MIVRIMGEGQYRLEGEAVGRLNELDNRAQEALERDDEGELDRYLEEMAALVRRDGERRMPMLSASRPHTARPRGTSG